MKRASIYVRVSSERQAEEVSPHVQEQDCTEYCQGKGYQVIDVYSDTEKYKVGKRMVEPSGTRSDRPQLKRALADSDAGKFDVLIAWREDRLYRGVNHAMLDINDRVKNKTLSVELVKEIYDPKMATVKAWAAGLELEAKHDRLIMGISGRYAKGAAWNGSTPYGYRQDERGFYIIDEFEAEVVRNIFTLFSGGHTVPGILKQLAVNSKKRWGISRLYHLLKFDYWSGITTRKLDGKNYDIILPAIIDSDLAQLVKGRFAKFKAYPLGNYKAAALCAGLVFCKKCGVRMVINRSGPGRNYITYRCQRYREFAAKDAPAECAKNRYIRFIDDDVWHKLWDLISEPGRFEKAIQDRIAELQAEETDASAVVARLERELGELTTQRMRVITWARTGDITQDDLKLHLGLINGQEREYNRELADKRLLIGGRAERMIKLAEEYRAQVKDGWDKLFTPDPTPEQAELIFQFKKKLIQGLVTRVEVLEDKSVEVHTTLDLGENVNVPAARWQTCTLRG